MSHVFEDCFIRETPVVFLVCMQAQKLTEPVANILMNAEFIRNKQINNS